MLVQIFLNGLISGLLYALVALGFSLIYSGTRVFHIAHGAIYTASVYLFLAFDFLFRILSIEQNLYTLLASLILSLTATSFLAVLFEYFIYRPLMHRNASPLVNLISSLGIYIIVVNLIALIFGNETKILNPEIETSFNIEGIIVTRIQLIQLIVSSIFITLIFIVIGKTTLGRNIRALSDNPALLSVWGINIKKVRLLIFTIGSILAASASLLKAFDVGVDPYVGLSAVLTAAVAIIVGGIGKHHGAVFAALLIGLTQNIVIWYTSAQWQEAVTFVILIIVLLVRKEGLFTSKLRLEER